MDYLTTHTSISPIWRGFAPGFVNYKKGCTRLAVACDKVYQLLAHGRWFSPGTPASSTTKTGCHDIAERLLKVALNTKNQIKSLQIGSLCYYYYLWTGVITNSVTMLLLFITCGQVSLQMRPTHPIVQTHPFFSRLHLAPF